MRIMTSNIWGNFFNNPTSLREAQLFKVYQKYNPDVIGFQEAAAGWYDVNLFKNLSDEYNLIGTACYNNTNSTPIAIKKEYSVIAFGHEQLANTPDQSKTITWAVIEKDGKKIGVCNTHFWWMSGYEADHVKIGCGVVGLTPEDHNSLRAQNAEQLAALMQHLASKFACIVFAFGDMNATVSENIYDVYNQKGIKSLYDLAKEKNSVCSLHYKPVLGDDGRFHGKRATEEYVKAYKRSMRLPDAENTDGHSASIDHIIAWGGGFETKRYWVVEDQDALDATDHSPVYVDIELL